MKLCRNHAETPLKQATSLTKVAKPLRILKMLPTMIESSMQKT